MIFFSKEKNADYTHRSEMKKTKRESEAEVPSEVEINRKEENRQEKKKKKTKTKEQKERAETLFFFSPPHSFLQPLSVVPPLTPILYSLSLSSYAASPSSRGTAPRARRRRP